MPKSWNLRDSWFIITLYLVNRLASNAEVFVRKFLDGYRKELLRDIRDLGSRSSQPLNQLLFLFSGQFAALNRYVRHSSFQKLDIDIPSMPHFLTLFLTFSIVASITPSPTVM